MNYDSNRLMRSLMILSIAGFVVLAFVLTTVFTNAFYENLNNSLSNIKIKYNKNAKIEAQDKIQKLVGYINIYKKTLEQSSKDRVRDNVNFAISVINDVCRQFYGFPKSIIYQKIADRLRSTRFFDDETGYFFIYDLKGNCILLPTNPELEGTNQINLLDGNKRYIIKDMIDMMKSQHEGSVSWSWYKINGHKMKKKIGYVKLYKPLDIFIGSARYKEDIYKDIKNDIGKYLKSLHKDEYGYIFAYDFSGNSVLEDGKLKYINRWNDVVRGNHLVRNAIEGAQIIPDGFFMKYTSKTGEKRSSYIELISDLNWVIGTNVKDITPLYKKEKLFLKKNMSNMLDDAILIALFILIVFIVVFLLISIKVGRLFKKLEKTIYIRTKELVEQKSVFKKLFDKASDGIVLSKNKRVFDCNDAIVKIFEAKNKEELLSIKTKDFFPQKQSGGIDSMEYFQNELDTIDKKEVVEFEIEALTFTGKKIWLNIVATPIVLQNERIGYFVIRDITNRKRAEHDLYLQQKKLEFQAKHDALTSLPNRISLMDRLHQCVKIAHRNKSYIAVAFLDIDNFKMVNDAFGHNIGDLLLIEVSSVLRSLVRESDIVSRFSGDEFVVVLTDLKTVDDSSNIIQKIVDRFQKPFFVQNNPFDITFSIGISLYPNDADDEQDLLKYADMAMYRVKNSGKNTYIYYDESMNTNILEHIKIEQDMKEGIKNDEFVLHYQPQFEVGSEKIIGFEALVRWQHPKLGLKFPDYFIDIAENSNLMIPLGEVISKKAMQQIAQWYEMGLNPGIMSINFTSKQLESDLFFSKLKKFLDESKCRPEWVEAELIERYVMSDTRKTT